MKQNIFETKQKADEMMALAAGLWQRSEKNEYLEGLEADPVFRLMMNALAYQSNEMQDELETVKEEIVQEFVRHTATGEGCNAVPVTALVRMSTEKTVSSVRLTGEETFTATVEGAGSFSFMPVLRTTVYALRVKSVSRLDMRRWSVSVESPKPLTNLSGLAFTVSDTAFRTLKVTIPSEGVVLPLISPQECHDLPVSENFSLKTLMFNRHLGADYGDFHTNVTPWAGYLAMDLLSVSGAGFFLVDDMPDFRPSESLEMIFEFDGIQKNFDFRYPLLSMNTTILANVAKSSATLSMTTPVQRLTGSEGDGRRSPQFLHLLPEEDIFHAPPVQIRRVRADRFNAGRLVGLLRSLVNKFHSDYYAFQSLGVSSAEGVIMNIRKDLDALMHMVVSKMDASFEGVYAILTDSGEDSKASFGRMRDTSASVTVNYLTTDGAAANVISEKSPVFTTPPGILSRETVLAGNPGPGFDEVRDERRERILMQYHAQTRDRLVTMYDIKLFCLKELYVRFDGIEEMMECVKVTRAPRDMGSWHTYVITVDIILKSNEAVRKMFDDEGRKVEGYLEKMIRVRMNGIYPVQVRLSVNNQ